MILLAESVLGELGKFDKVTVRSSTDVVKIAKLVEAIVIWPFFMKIYGT